MPHITVVNSPIKSVEWFDFFFFFFLDGGKVAMRSKSTVLAKAINFMIHAIQEELNLGDRYHWIHSRLRLR